MKRTLMWLVVGIALVWGASRWWASPSSPVVPKGSGYLESVKTAKQVYDERVADVLWQQSLAGSDTVPLTLDNQSGMEVYVKVVSLDVENATLPVKVADGARVRVECPTGRFFLKMRYENGNSYTYQRGDDFTLGEGSTTEITLHKVPMGNYGSSPMDASQF